jgi:hypothetical protein
LSKVWNIIQRFSEDIDMTVDRELFDLQGDLTVKQIKKLRKQNSFGKASPADSHLAMKSPS